MSFIQNLMLQIPKKVQNIPEFHLKKNHNLIFYNNLDIYLSANPSFKGISFTYVYYSNSDSCKLCTHIISPYNPITVAIFPLSVSMTSPSLGSS